MEAFAALEPADIRALVFCGESSDSQTQPISKENAIPDCSVPEALQCKLEMGAIFNSMLIIAIKTRSCSARPVLGRNNHPSFVAVAVLLEKKLIYKMAISRKKLLSLPDKAIYSGTFWGALSGKFLFETKHYKPQIWKNGKTPSCSTKNSCRANATHHATETMLGDSCFEIPAFGLEQKNHITPKLFICEKMLLIKASMVCKQK